jgi:hypothetical protein
MRNFAAVVILNYGLLAHASPALAAITDYSDRATFMADTGATTVEDFGTTAHFPISTGILNWQTNLPNIGLTPGTILPGVTYSTQIGTGCCFFNIDVGGPPGSAASSMQSACPKFSR